MKSMASKSPADNYAGMILKRSFLAFIVILFFCDIAIYLSLGVSVHLEPQYWIGFTVAFGILLAWFSPQARWEMFRTPLFLWAAFFLVLTVVLFVTVRTSHIEQFKEQVRTVVLLVTLFGVFLMLRDELSFTRKLIVIAVVLGVVVNGINLFDSKFPPRHTIMWIYRAVGFYPNPNESAVALILGMALSVGVLSRRWRAPYLIIVFVGVLATFSREAVLGWLLVVVCLCASKVVSWRATVAYVIALAVCTVIASLIIVELRVIRVSSLNYYYDQAKRFGIFFNGIGHDYSSVERWKVLNLGWTSFLAHPLVGNGIGSTYHWSMPISTHNMYLLYMDDYGVTGIFLYPLLIWAMAGKAVGKTRKFAWTMAIFLLFWGLFDHNIVQNYYSLFAISLTAAMSRISEDEPAGEIAPTPAEAASG